MAEKDPLFGRFDFFQTWPIFQPALQPIETKNQLLPAALRRLGKNEVQFPPQDSDLRGVLHLLQCPAQVRQGRPLRAVPGEPAHGPGRRIEHAGGPLPPLRSSTTPAEWGPLWAR